MFHDYDCDFDWAASLANELADKKYLEELRNEKRDERGRLKKGSRIAAKLSCDREEIRYLYKMGLSARQIVEEKGCSKSTVYNAISGIRESERFGLKTLPF